MRFCTLDGMTHECSGEILVFERPSRLVMSWQWHGNEADGESQIVVSLRAAGRGCELTFIHERLPADEMTVRGHEQGWNGSLNKLERYLRKAKTRASDD